MVLRWVILLARIVIIQYPQSKDKLLFQAESLIKEDHTKHKDISLLRLYAYGKEDLCISATLSLMHHILCLGIHKKAYITNPELSVRSI